MGVVFNLSRYYIHISEYKERWFNFYITLSPTILNKLQLPSSIFAIKLLQLCQHMSRMMRFLKLLFKMFAANPCSRADFGVPEENSGNPFIFAKPRQYRQEK